MSQQDYKHDDRPFDRLVDGELSAGERRALLASLDDRENGWRQCALAFLEAQCWQRELTGLVHESASPPPADACDMVAVARTNGERPFSLAHWLSLAASVLVAFGVGLWVRGSVAPGVATAPPHEIVAQDDAAPPAAHFATVVPPTDNDSDVLRMLVRDPEGRSQPLRVPLIDADIVDRQLGLTFRSGVPAELRQQLEASGYRVESRRRYAPLWLDDDRPFVVPVEDTQIVPVSRHVY